MSLVYWSTIAIILSMSYYIVLSMLSFPFLPYEAKAVETGTSLSSSLRATSTIHVHTISSSSSSSQSNNSTTSGCINYDPSTRTITVSCTTPTRLTDVNNALNDNGILAKQTPDGTWFLNANLVISKGAVFHIDSTDTKWLKISSKVVRGAGTTAKLGPAYWIDVHGSLKIDSVKITSWDPTMNYYAITNGSRTGTDVFILGAPRPSIVVENNATGTTNITNSEIAYLGFEQGKHKGGSGLSYYHGGDGSIIKNNIIREVYFGLYTFGVGHMIVENNIIRNLTHIQEHMI